MTSQAPKPHVNQIAKTATSTDVKSSLNKRRRERFGEAIRYLTMEELQQFLDAIEGYRHKLMMRIICELGCRVGEFVRIQLRHLSFSRNTVYFPAENTKTRQRRVCHLPKGMINEIKCLLRAEGRMARRSDRIDQPLDYLFFPGSDTRRRYTENRIRQIFRHYVRKAGLSSEYGTDRRGRSLHELTVHSLRRSHIMHYVHVHKLPLPIVQKQVGHKSLKTTSVYLRQSDEHVGQAYAEARRYPSRVTNAPKDLNTQVSSSFYNGSRNPPTNGS